MRKLAALVALFCLAGGAAVAGVGVWTTSTPLGTGNFVAADRGLPGVVYTEKARSTDGGQSWVSTGFGEYVPVHLAVGTPGRVYVSAYIPDSAAIFASQDAGVHWDMVVTRPKPAEPDVWVAWFECMFGDPNDPQMLYAQFSPMVQELHGQSRRATFERSSDGGRTWRLTGFPLNGSNFLVASLAIDPSNPRVLLAAVNDFSVGISTYRSVDGGDTWQLVPTATSYAGLVFDPLSPGVVYGVGLNGLTKSVDHGETFVPVTSNLGSMSVLVLSPTKPGRFFVLSVGTAFASSDFGASWEPLQSGGGFPYLNGLAIDSTGRFLHAPDVSERVYDYQLTDPLTLNAPYPFTVTLSATDQRTGRTGSGVATRVNDLWGWFSIPAITNNPNNPEVFVKLLDGTALNGSYWFFYGGLTDLEYTLTVKDDTTGQQKTYTKPAGSECGGSDTAAFTP